MNEVVNKKKLKWWQVALISLAVSALGGLSSMMSSKKERKVYSKYLKQAPWAPPSWVFAPAWMINNFFVLRALRRIMESNAPDKKKLLWLQGGIWFIFFSFNYVYFKKKSPVLASVWTMSDAVLAIASMLLSAKTDKKTAANYVPLVAWTSFASTLANYQALKNPDGALGTRALLN